MVEMIDASCAGVHSPCRTRFQYSVLVESCRGNKTTLVGFEPKTFLYRFVTRWQLQLHLKHFVYQNCWICFSFLKEASHEIYLVGTM